MQDNQWLLDGNCDLCRRNDYCTKPCKTHKENVNRAVKNLVASELDRITGGAYRDVIEKERY